MPGVEGYSEIFELADGSRVEGWYLSDGFAWEVKSERLRLFCRIRKKPL